MLENQTIEELIDSLFNASVTEYLKEDDNDFTFSQIKQRILLMVELEKHEAFRRGEDYAIDNRRYY